MWKSIFVPLDGSTFGEHALPLAMSIARRTGAALKLIHVHAPLKAIYLEGAAFLDESVDDDIKAHQQAYLDIVARRVKQILSTPVDTQLLVGEVSSSVGEAVAKQGADLVVMTTHGRGPMGRFWLGSVADELVRQLPVPLLLVRPVEADPDLNREPEIRHVLIALDGSEWAEKILGTAVALGNLWQADYTLVRIIKPVMPVDAPIEVPSVAQAVQSVMQRMDTIQDQLKLQAQKYLDGVAARLRSQGLKVQTKVDISERPAAGILEDIEATPADMVAIETHGRSGLSRLFLGSTADKVVRGAHVPVLIHRPA
jgi:nucleotide-binding universal stress UspA family protein